MRAFRHGFLLQSLMAFCFVGFTTSIANAQERMVRLQFESIAECPTVERFSDEVSARLGYVPFSDQASETVLVTFTSGSGLFHGRMQIGGETRVHAEPTCDRVAAALVEALAIVLQPQLEPVAPVAPTPAPAPLLRGGEMGLPRLLPPATVFVRAVGDPGFRLAGTEGYSLALQVQNVPGTATCPTFPCEIELPRGSHFFNVARQGEAYGVPVHLLVQRDMEVAFRIEDRSVIRWVLRVAAIAALAGGIAMTLSGLPGLDRNEPQVFSAGLGTIGFGLLLALVLPSQGDRAVALPRPITRDNAISEVPSGESQR